MTMILLPHPSAMSCLFSPPCSFRARHTLAGEMKMTEDANDPNLVTSSSTDSPLRFSRAGEERVRPIRFPQASISTIPAEGGGGSSSVESRAFASGPRSKQKSV